jgi:hypothetical protein
VLVEQREPTIEPRFDLQYSMDLGIGALHELTPDANSHVTYLGVGAYRNLVANVNGV